MCESSAVTLASNGISGFANEERMDRKTTPAYVEHNHEHPSKTPVVSTRAQPLPINLCISASLHLCARLPYKQPTKDPSAQICADCCRGRFGPREFSAVLLESEWKQLAPLVWMIGSSQVDEPAPGFETVHGQFASAHLAFHLHLLAIPSKHLVAEVWGIIEKASWV